MSLTLLLWLAVQVVVPPHRASVAPVPARPHVVSLIARPVKRNPYARLFRTADVTAGEQSSSTAAAPGRSRNPNRVCGMPVWQVDPKMDARIQAPLPGGDVTFTLRRVPLPACPE